MISTSVNNTKPWIEKYRPSSLDNIVSHQYIIDTLKQYIKIGTFPNLILFGSSGTGKTSLIKACSKELFGDDTPLLSLEINASEERGIDVIRSSVTQFANRSHSMSFNVNNLQKNQLIILDEADSMTFDAQLALKNVMDTFPKTKFCLICNCIKKLHISLISRCIKFRLHPLNPTQITDRLNYIINLEKINISNEAINKIVMQSNGDMRRAINILQSIHTAHGNKEIIHVNYVVDYLNQFDDNLINTLLITLSTNDINNSFNELTNLMQQNNYSFHELLNSLMSFSLLSINKNFTGNQNNTIFTKNQLYNLIKHLGKLEYQQFSNVNTNVLMLSLISFIYKLKNNDV
jgi:replication factor C subunit 3/5